MKQCGLSRPILLTILFGLRVGTPCSGDLIAGIRCLESTSESPITGIRVLEVEGLGFKGFPAIELCGGKLQKHSMRRVGHSLYGFYCIAV